MQTTEYGYRIPEQGDRAKGVAGWFAALVFNFLRLSGHNHDGANSPALSLSSISPYSNTVSAGSWAADGSGGGYKQTVTVPAGVTEISNYHVDFIFTAPSGKVGERAHLNFKRLTATTYEVYCNDNTAAFTAVYR